MAILREAPPPGFERRAGESAEQCVARAVALINQMQEVSDDLPPGEIVGGIITLSTDDGCAHFRIVEAEPLALEYIPRGLTQNLDLEFLQSLTKEDIARMLEATRKTLQLYDRKGYAVRWH